MGGVCYEHISFDWSLIEPLDYLTNNRYPIEAVVSFSIRHIYVPVLFCSVNKVVFFER